VPNLAGALSLGKTASGTGSTLNTANGAALNQQSALVTLNQASTTETVNPPSYSVNMTISSPAPTSFNYSNVQPQYGGSINSFASVSGASTGSDNGTVLPSVAWNAGALSSSQAGAQSNISSSTWGAPYLALLPYAYTTGAPAASAGTVSAYAGSDVPVGWLRADGSCLKKSTYLTLFTAIDYTYGGAGNIFCLPDMRGRIPAGLASVGAASVLGEKSGSIAPQPTVFLPTNPSSIALKISGSPSRFAAAIVMAPGCSARISWRRSGSTRSALLKTSRRGISPSPSSWRIASTALICASWRG